MKKRAYILFTLCLIFAQPICAQDSTPEITIKKKQSYRTDTRHWSIEIPVWIPGFRGEFVYGDVDLEGEDGTLPSPEHPIEEPGFGDVFKRLFRTSGDLNYFFITNIAYRNKKFNTELDFFTGDMGASLKFRYNNQKLVSVDIHSNLFRLAAGYQLFKRPVLSDNANYELFAYTGMRVQKFKVNSELNKDKSLKIDPLWIEPILGVKNEFTFDYWKFVIQADLGSFGMNDKFSYMLNLYSFYRITNVISFKLGWNGWYINYKDRFDNEDLKLKVHLAGPVAALVFNF